MEFFSMEDETVPVSEYEYLSKEEESVAVIAEHREELYEAADVARGEELNRDEEHLELSASLSPMKEYEYSFEAKEAVTPAFERKEVAEEKELISPTKEKAKEFREDETVPVSEYEYLTKEEEPVPVIAEHREELYEAADLARGEELKRDEEHLEVSTSLSPVKEYEYSFEAKGEIAPALERKEAAEEKELISPTKEKAKEFREDETVPVSEYEYLTKEEEPVPVIAEHREELYEAAAVSRGEELKRDEEHLEVSTSLSPMKEGSIELREEEVVSYAEKGAAIPVSEYELEKQSVTKGEQETVSVIVEHREELYEAADVAHGEELKRDEEHLELSASLSPMKEYEYSFEAKEAVTPAFERKEAAEEKELISPTKEKAKELGKMRRCRLSSLSPVKEYEYSFEAKGEIAPALERKEVAEEKELISPTKEKANEFREDETVPVSEYEYLKEEELFGDSLNIEKNSLRRKKEIAPEFERKEDAEEKEVISETKEKAKELREDETVPVSEYEYLTKEEEPIPVMAEHREELYEAADVARGEKLKRDEEHLELSVFVTVKRYEYSFEAKEK
uniref:Uncharacterized protein n=1 Tax=Parascaris univalens TaxID=6257 RepID=A0A915ADA3_PARUN